MSFVDPGDPRQLTEGLRAELTRRFARDAEVVVRAPGRVNLIGEHTDYNRGLVLPVALPHATYVVAAARDDGRVRLASRQSEDEWSGVLDEIGPGTVDGWPAYAAGVLWAMRDQGLEVTGLDLVLDSTVPLGAGLSSSAALECAVAVAVAGLTGLELTTGVRHDLVAACMRAEAEVAGAPTGGMDQTIAMLATAGSALLVDFDHDLAAPDATRSVPLALDGVALLVTDTRVSHALVDGGYGDRRAECDRAAAALGVASLRAADAGAVESLEDPVLRRRARHVVAEIQRTADTVAALTSPGGVDWDEVGRLFAASHVSMREDFEISCAELDTAVATAVEAGAWGARMTGGGFGGSSVAVVPTARVDAVALAIDAAFAGAGHRPPRHLLAPPSGAAGPLDAAGVTVQGGGG